MQWTTTGDRITLPYVAPEDDLQSTPATIKALAEAVVAELENVSGTPTGSLTAYMKGPDGVPEGWLECNGDPFDMDANPKLAAIFTNGITPDLRDRAPMAAGTNVTEKAAGGGTVTLGVTNLPSHGHSVFLHDPTHSHSVPVRADGGGYTAANNNAGPPGGYLATDGRGTGQYPKNSAGTANWTDAVGDNTPFDVVPAHYGVSCYIIKGG